MNRRDALRRIGLLPFSIGAAISQAPALGRTLFAEAATASPMALQEEITYADRLRWFTNAIQGWVSGYRPNVPIPDEAAEWSPALARAIYAWSGYLSRVAEQARDNRISLDEAAQIADVPVALLRELMPG